MPDKPGRPPTGNAREFQYRLMLHKDEAERLEYACTVLGLTKADVLRQGINQMYEIALSKKEE